MIGHVFGERRLGKVEQSRVEEDDASLHPFELCAVLCSEINAHVFPEIQPPIRDLRSKILQTQFGTLGHAVAAKRLALVGQSEGFRISGNWRQGQSLSVGHHLRGKSA